MNNYNLFIITMVIFCGEWLSIVKSGYYEDYLYSNVMECVNIGEKCSGYYSICNGGSCQFQDVIDKSLPIKICSKFKKLNESCFNDGDCETGLTCTGLLGGKDNNKTVCAETNFAFLGETCVNNIQCIGNFECINSVCTNTTVECRGIYDCPSEYYCNSRNCIWVNLGSEDESFKNNCSDSRCVPVLDKGDYCFYDGDCKLGLFCGNDNTCIEKNSLQLGDNCKTETNFEQCDISKSLICQANICIKRNESNTSNCLEDGCEFSDELCDAECGKCVHYHQIFSEKCKIAEKNRDVCFIKNKCPFPNRGDVNLSNSSCSMRYCSNETYEYLNQCQILHSKKSYCSNNV